MRALLTMLGIIIGIASVIAIITLGDSLSGTISSSMQEIGASNVTLALQSKNTQGSNRNRSFIPDDKSLISDSMVEELIREFPNEIKAVSISNSIGSGRTTSGKKYANLTLTGVNNGYRTANNITMKSGRFLNDLDQNEGKKVAVVSDKLAANMFGMQDPLGQPITVTLSDHTDVYVIVGVYQYEAGIFGMSMSADSDTTTDVYIPLSTSKRVTKTSGYQSITLVIDVKTDSIAFSETASEFMNRYYSRNKNFRIAAFSMESMLETMTDMLASVQLAIAAIAAISLLVGGIGVMNIMLVSITERTREIGTRKAIGAKNSAIMTQFIVESVIICLIGGIIGIALGIAIGSVGAGLIGVTAVPSISTIAISTGFSMFIGVFFGYYPANKAAKLDPIEALRYE